MPIVIVRTRVFILPTVGLLIAVVAVPTLIKIQTCPQHNLPRFRLILLVQKRRSSFKISLPQVTTVQKSRNASTNNSRSKTRMNFEKKIIQKYISNKNNDDDGSVNERSSSSLFLVQYYIINQSSSPFPRILSRWGESTITARRKEQEGGARQRHRRQDERITYYSTSLHYPVAPGQKKKVKK